MGAEMETAVASRAVRWVMERRYGAETKGRIYVSALPDTPMAVMAKEEGHVFLPMPTQPGGAYSALTAATLLPLAAAGVDPLEVLEGAAEAYGQYDLRAFENPVWMYAGARYALYGKGRATELLGTFDPAFTAFGKWWAQWVCRHTCQDGVGVLPVPMELTGGLDALDLMISSGRYPLFETLLLRLADLILLGVDRNIRLCNGCQLNSLVLRSHRRFDGKILCMFQIFREIHNMNSFLAFYL